MNNLCTDVGYRSINKHGEQLCGDHVEIIEKGDNYTVLVLADGLGSGVKASILSTLTSKIISTMIANNMSIEDCVSTIAATLPVCEVRKVAYSTFTIMCVRDNSEAEIIQYDNPQVILLRDGKNYDYAKNVSEMGGKTIYTSKIQLCENDVFIAMSDGAIWAGVGKYMNFGWQRENIIEYIERLYEPNYTAKVISTLILDECNSLYGNEPGDDTTVAAIKIRQRKPVNLLFGPPADPKDANKMMALFFSKEGKRIVAGGTTSTIAAEYLGTEVCPDLDYLDPDIPPTAEIKGVDLTTEGVITMTRVLEYAKSYITDNECYYDWSTKRDGASRIARILFEEATDINFFVGRAKNPAHQNPNLPINFSIKMRIADELAECLKKMGKRINVSYF
ncbi:MAG: serine/threonine-protein phosphatase [Oscillospiraceae bacterium]|nr:serine/threonine-protein phosphatase [Oscillospiraceae bacterium]